MRACAEEAAIVRLARPHERADHRVVGEGLADAPRAHVVQHLVLGRLAAPQLDEDVLRVAARALDEFLRSVASSASSASARAVTNGPLVWASCLGVAGVTTPTASLKTRATCFIVCPSPPALCAWCGGSLRAVWRVDTRARGRGRVRTRGRAPQTQPGVGPRVRVCAFTSPRLTSQCVRLDICATAEARLSAGSFHHLGLMR